jgi:hypothetical protein
MDSNECERVVKLFLLFIWMAWFTCPRMTAQSEQGVGMQSALLMLDELYGTDPFLVNGIWRAYSYGDMKGHPYLETPEFHPSILYHKQGTYSGVLINYDIVQDKVILQHRNSYDAIEDINLNNMEVDSFSIGNRIFRHLALDQEDGFYHTRSTFGSMSFVSRYSKTIRLDSFSGSGEHYFTNVSEALFFFDGTILLRVKGWYSFSEYFTKEDYKRLRKESIRDLNITNISDDQLLEILKVAATIRNH